MTRTIDLEDLVSWLSVHFPCILWQYIWWWSLMCKICCHHWTILSAHYSAWAASVCIILPPGPLCPNLGKIFTLLNFLSQASSVLRLSGSEIMWEEAIIYKDITHWDTEAAWPLALCPHRRSQHYWLKILLCFNKFLWGCQLGNHIYFIPSILDLHTSTAHILM